MKALQFVAVISLVLPIVSSCSKPLALSDRTDPVVKAEEARIATLLSSKQTLLGVPSACRVRLLGQEAGASFVWASCEARDSSYSASVPLRVTGPKVTRPGEGAAFSETVREMFPEDLADYVLANQDSPNVRP